MIDRLTHTQTKYGNPRCTCAPRVNEYTKVNNTHDIIIFWLTIVGIFIGVEENPMKECIHACIHEVDIQAARRYRIYPRPFTIPHEGSTCTLTNL